MLLRTWLTLPRPTPRQIGLHADRVMSLLRNDLDVSQRPKHPNVLAGQRQHARSSAPHTSGKSTAERAR